MSGDTHPTPEQVQEERRAGDGQLKVFLGYASNIEKTVRLLDEGRWRKSRGQDVVVGWLQPRPNTRVQTLADQLEVIAPKLGEMDLDAILARHPRVCLVDELVHVNPPGSRHAERWQDVQELLEAGINVITAIDVEDLQGRQDSSRELLGVWKAVSVPERFVLGAEEVVLVDVCPEVIAGPRDPTDLDPVTRTRAREADKLQQLRGMALLYTADAVEHQVEDYRLSHQISSKWSTHERILVCVTPHHQGADLVEKGRKAAQLFHAELWAVYVTPDPEWSNVSRAQRTMVEQHLELARSYQAKVAVLVGTSVVETIVPFAVEHRITQILIGHTLHRPFPHPLSQSKAGRIIRQAKGIDVHVVADPVGQRRDATPTAVAVLQVPPPSRHLGRLRVFLGYAAGVGKTYQMLSDAHAFQSQGHEVAIGYFEPHKRPDTSAQVGNLPMVPCRTCAYRGCEFAEMDLPAILARKPELCLVDELAHTNVPGLEHKKRWQDVSDLLDAGIHVWTTLNVQHLESLNDSVYAITGVRVRETVPDWFVDAADEIVFVDVTTQDLINRLQRGAVYSPERAQDALKNFFREGNLNALRELAMRQTADDVERGLLEHSEVLALPSGEVVLVCLTERPATAAMVRRGKRMADRIGAACYALYVVHDAQWSDVSPEDRHMVEEHLALARGLHLKTEVIVGKDVATSISEFALHHKVTQLFFGRSLQSGWRELFDRNIIERVIRQVSNVDVHVVADG